MFCTLPRHEEYLSKGPTAHPPFSGCRHIGTVIGFVGNRAETPTQLDLQELLLQGQVIFRQSYGEP